MHGISSDEVLHSYDLPALSLFNSQASLVKPMFFGKIASKLTHGKQSLASMVPLHNREMTFIGEYLFKPDSMHVTGDSELISLQAAIGEVINKCPIDCRNDMWNNLCLSGGMSLLPGLPRRLRNELLVFKSDNYAKDINVLTENNRDLSNWQGAGILSILDEMESKWEGKWEYEESGAYQKKRLNSLSNVEGSPGLTPMTAEYFPDAL
jgi:hypothetical protein